MHYKNLYSFLYNEVKEKISPEKKDCIEKHLLKSDPTIFQNFQEKCLIGENDSHICNIIRQDLIDEFVIFTNQHNISLSSTIKKSIFETNSFLINRNPTLIEYSTFFGSIQIFQYLRLNNVELTPSLWLYTIHSNNAELIHLLENNNIKPNDETYTECLIESIKCHHNDFADYFICNLLNNSKINIRDESIRFYNFHFFNKNNLYDTFPFYTFFKYYHDKVVNVYITTKEKDIKEELIIFNFHLNYI